MRQNATAETLREVPSMDSGQKDIAVGVALVVTLGTGKQITFQTYYSQGVSIEEQNDLLDRLVAAGDRLNARAAVRDIERNIEAREITLKSLAEDLLRLREQGEAKWREGGRRGDYRPSAQEQASIQNAETALKRHKEELDRIKRDLDENKALAGQ